MSYLQRPQLHLFAPSPIPSPKTENPQQPVQRRIKTQQSSPIDFESLKHEQLRRIQRDIRDYNWQSFKEQQGHRKQLILRDKQEASQENMRINEQISKEEEERRRRRRSIQQSLFGEYKHHMQVKLDTRNRSKEIDRFYDKLEAVQNDKEDDVRTREISKIIDGAHQLHIPAKRVQTEGYETAARKELSRQLNRFITMQAQHKRQKEKQELERSLREEQTALKANINLYQQQQQIQKMRKKQEQQRLRQALLKQIDNKNEGKSNFPPIVQYRTHRLSELDLRHS